MNMMHVYNILYVVLCVCMVHARHVIDVVLIVYTNPETRWNICIHECILGSIQHLSVFYAYTQHDLLLVVWCA